MSARDNQDVTVSSNRPDGSRDLPSTIIKYLEPATLLTISLGAVYYLGWIQVDSYLRRIGINHHSLNLPSTYYLRQGYLAVSISLILINVVAWNKRPARDTVKDAILLNLIPLLLLILMLFPDASLSRQQYYFNLAFLVMVLVLLICLTVVRKSAVHLLLSPSLFYRFGFALTVFTILGVRAMNVGDLNGKLAVEGRSSEVSGITFVWKDTIAPDIEGKQLVLILHNEGKYYVVERATTAPAHPRVYVVPDDMVKYASTTSLWW